MATATFDLPSSTTAYIERYARDRGISQNDVIVEAVSKLVPSDPLLALQDDEKQVTHSVEGNVREPLFQPSSVEYKSKLVPRDEWEAEILTMGIPCGVSLSDEALSREEMYD